MAITSVDSFIRIFKFYQANPLVRKERDLSTGKIKSITLKDTFKANNLIYEDTVDVYLHSLTLDKLTQLSYDTDSDTIQHAINAREKLSTYFSKVLYPGSYAFSTLDNATVRKMMLDWSSTIKTIQDANKKVTNAYSLSSDDVDKAIRGFGIDFINSTNLKSSDRRKNFLLNICDLYAIKGSPNSIIKALNIIGLEDIFIREAWICKDVEKYNGDYDLRMCWKAQKLDQEFDEVTNQYLELNTHDDIYTTWEWFKEKIEENDSTFDPHWFYTQDEIKAINNDDQTYIKLPSITPYFGIEFTSDLDRNIDSLDNLFTEITTQYQSFFLSETGKGKTIWVDTFPNRINILECYTALIYTLIRVDEHIQYDNFKSYLELNKFTTPEFTYPNEYLKLIYWMYQHKNDTFEISYNKLLNDYIPIKSNGYISYENVLRWWLEEEVSDLERKGTYDEETEKWDGKPVITDQLYIQPRRANTSEIYDDFISLEWDNVYPMGRYCVEAYNEEDGWTEVVTNAYIYDTKMSCCVSTDYAEHGSDSIDEFRIVVYHHPANIPDIFFHPPFNFNAKPLNTMFDRVLRYNGVATNLSYYDKDDTIYDLFVNQQTADNSTDYDVMKGYHSQEADGSIRTTQIHDNLKLYYCSAYNYPAKTKLFEDKWMNINATFYDYVDWAINDYYDIETHNGQLESNILENRKWPINKKWNWAVDSKYFYVCYEANKWMRYPVIDFVENIGRSNSSYSYGDRIILNGRLYVYVASSKWAVIDNIELTWTTKDCDLSKDGKIKAGSKLSRDLAVAVIKNEDIISLLYQTGGDKSSTAYKEALKTLNQSTIELYTQPYGNQLVTTNCYTYSAFLTYLYNNRLTLDFNTGYIYPVIEGYNDSHGRIYLKCHNISGNTIWIRFNNQKDNLKWDNCDNCKSIYSDANNCGIVLPPYSLPNRYDSFRILDGRTFNYRKELIEAFESGQLPDDINLAVVRPYNKNNAGKYEETEGKYMNTHPVIYKKVQKITEEGSLKVVYDWVQIDENRFNDCKLGINPDLIDWIEEMFATNNQNFVDLPNVFAEAVNSYLINTLGVSGSVLDLIIAGWTTSNIVKKIVNYYKPKRARLLFVSDALDYEYSLTNGLDNLGITDNDYNYYDLVTYRWGNPNFDVRNLSRMNRERISHVINEYTPVEDTIYKDSDDSYKVFNYRELHTQDSKIPEIEVYDEFIDLTRQTVATRNGTAYAAFYVHNFNYQDSMNGFYYCISLDGGEKIYSNNSWYFQKCQFVTRSNGSKIKMTTRWALFKSDDNTCDKDYAYYVADHESNDPWICDDNTAIKYGNCTKHSRFIDEYDFSEGTFDTSRYIKTNLRTLAPVLYFRCFDNEECNGFYYCDSTIHPDRNDAPVYYNLKGKMISLIDTTNFYERTDPMTGESTSRFWCITDYRQIVDFDNADYFAYIHDDTSIFNRFNTDFTKDFHKLSCRETENKDSDSALVGCRISFLYDHPDIIRDHETNYTLEYDKYHNFVKNHVNRVELKKQPVGCLVSNGKYVINYFNYDNDKKTIHWGDLDNVDTKPCVNLTIDDIGNEKGAFELRGNNVFRTKINNSLKWTVSFRIRFIDENSVIRAIFSDNTLVNDKWYMFTYTSEDKFYVDGTLRNDIAQNIISKDDEWVKLNFNEINCDIAEMATWDEVLGNWYIKVISNFRILRNRPEPNKSKTNKSASNYRPLFAVDEPRVVFDRWSTGLPENIVGGRLQEYFADEYKKNHEENPLWVNRLPHDIEKDFIVKGGANNWPVRDKIAVGTELEASGDYRPNDTIQWWWMRYNKDFKTGPIHHRPVYISSKQVLNDPYPVINNGQEKKGNYCDIGLTFDGPTNTSNHLYLDNDFVNKSNSNTYIDEAYDNNTAFGFNETSAVKLENYGDTYKHTETLNNLYIPDLDQLNMNSGSFRNFIFHETIYLYGGESIYSEFTGTWKHSKEVKSWKEGDFKECYSKDNKFEAVFTYNKDTGYFWWEIRKLNDENVWEPYFRTYVNARHNQSRLMYIYDLLNYHQIDICNQTLCKYKENEFVNKCWAEVEQETINTSFGCNTWISFEVKNNESEKSHPGIDRYFDGRYYHMVFDQNWYTVAAEKVTDGFKYLPETSTPSGYLYADKYLYIWINPQSVKLNIKYTNSKKTNIAHKTQVEDTGYWIRINVSKVININERIPYEQWKFRKTNANSVVVNVPDSTNADCTDNTYISQDVIDIRETAWKLFRFNGINDWKWWEHMNEEFPYLKSVNNDISCTIASVKDTLLYMTFDKSNTGKYYKVKHPNGIIEFVTTVGSEDRRLTSYKYKKNDSLSNV